MDKYEVLGIGMIITVVVLLMIIFFLLIDLNFQFNKEIEACKNIDMEKQEINGFETCVDSQGNANIVKFHCKGLLWNKQCSVQIIKLQTFGVNNVK